MSRASIFCVAALLCAAIPGIGNASVIFNNFGPEREFPPSGEGMESFDGNLHQEVFGFGPSFTVTGGSYFLNQISLPLLSIGGSQLTLTLMRDSAGKPGQPLETFSIGGVISAPDVYTVHSALQPVLGQDQTYWLVGSVRSNAVDIAWMGVQPEQPGIVARGPYLDGHWSVFGSDLVTFQVLGDPVPEPTSALLFVAGLVLTARNLTARKIKSKAAARL